ncbi:MAG: shikimate dehydrogenase [Lachnospiraceae bacterium]|nr:shikimate dehydrogenase [Lachnospiraceae bacterium]
MNINGKTRTCGLIGKPVEHTMSPVIHNTLAEELGINMVYVPFLVEENLKDAVQGAYALNLLGMNVTVPYKSEVLESLVVCDELAKKIGAVNTLVREEQGYKGYNTDMTGLYRAMKSYGIEIEGEKIIILGAGGAARAVAFLCLSYGAEKVYILNRSIEKAKAIATEVNEVMKREGIIAMTLEDYSRLPEEKMLCIQATSVGLAPNDGDAVITDEAFYKRIHTGYDLIYRPANTRFMQLVKEQGGKAYHGLKMLLYQGVEAFELWNQVTVSEELADKVYEVMKGVMKIEE